LVVLVRKEDKRMRSRKYQEVVRFSGGEESTAVRKRNDTVEKD